MTLVTAYTGEFLGAVASSSATFVSAVTTTPIVAAGNKYSVWIEGGFSASVPLRSIEIRLSISDLAATPIEARDCSIVRSSDAAEPKAHMIAFHSYANAGARLNDFEIRRKAGASGSVTVHNPRICGIKVT